MTHREPHIWDGCCECDCDDCTTSDGNFCTCPECDSINAGAMLKDDLLDIIGQRIADHPRSAQSTIGPSELGMPCTRKLAHRLAGTERQSQRPAWRTAVGTAVHAYLAETFDSFNENQDSPVPRFHVEKRVTIGQAGGVDITGTADLFDRETFTVVDWKIVGATSLKAARLTGPKPQYRTQVHCYGAGFVNRGERVERVAIMWLPQSGELHDAVFWSEPYDPEVVTVALARADGVETLLKAFGTSAWAMIPRADDYCMSCPFRRSNAQITDHDACPGVI